MTPWARTPTVAIDGRNLLLAQGTGVATYAASVVAACRDLELPTRIIASDRSAVPPAARILAPHRRLREAGDRLGAPSLFRTAHVRFGLTGRPTAIVLPAGIDLVHWTYPLPLLARGVPNIVTVHDLVPITDPHLSGVDGSRLLRLLRRIVPLAAHVLTVSEHSRAQILRLLDVDPARVTNLGQPVELDAGLRAEIAAAPRVCPPGAFVAIGRVEPRKNIARLVEAHRRSGTATPLVVIGPDGDGAVPQLDAAVRRGAPEVLRVPFASRASLLRAVGEARALVFPSLAEGFGLPILEAMALGTPVLTSQGGATGEIAAAAAVLVDPLDTEAIAAGLRRLDRDDGERARLAAAGHRRVETFGRASFAARLEAIYREALATGPGLDRSGRCG